MFSKEDVEILAYQRYKSNESYEKSVWYLAELCVKINKNVRNGYDIKPLETDNVVLLIRDDVDGQLIPPSVEEIREVAEIIYKEAPPKSQLDWFIAEKSLLYREIKKAIENHHRNKDC
ncbi:MAG: hypothetical protein EU533_08545 [Promethearchaeota archaeon]|nr:MAG: hypothetical protein EU533_08545 [Candidatus Lokiarchaeota archaeon]